MDASTTEFNIDLGTFDIRDYVPDPDGASGLFDDRQAREKARHGGPHGPQRTQQNTGAQGISQGYYGHAPVPEMAAGYPSPMPTTLGAPALSIEQLDALLNMSLGQTSMGQHHSSGEQGTLPNADTLKERLAQQLRLQQLQQLQNHILQQQIQLLTAGARPLSQKDAQQLLTPASTNIRSASQSTQVSPNILPPGMFHPPASDYHTQRSTHFDPHNTMSAPASLAFDMNARGVPQSPASDFLTPLTSPVFPPTSPQRKRTAESFEGDPNDGTSGGGARKRLAHANSFGNMGLTLGMTSVSPALLSSASKHRHTNSAIDTPSPIDLSMPPPAAPGYLGGMATDPSYQRSHLSMSAMNTDTEMGMPLTIQGSRRPSLSGPSSKGTTTNVSPDLLPATPSLLMNMGNLSLPQGLIPPSMMTTDSNHRGSGPPSAQPSVPNSPARKTKTLTTRSRAASAAATASNNNDPSSSTSTTTASGKPRRAAAAAASSRTAAAAASGGASSLRNSSTSGNTTFGGGPKMKSTHKDAEQKRRDSLKTSFDELRVLLPPIPLSASGFGGDDSDEAPLPGAMPPRGPPRGDGSGPNKGVSKLVLLRCGNEFIRDLAGRVERRDAEIERLRAEVRRLRGVLGSVMGPGPGTSYADFGGGAGGVEDPVDLEKDLEKEDEWYREERRRAKKKRADAIEEES